MMPNAFKGIIFLLSGVKITCDSGEVRSERTKMITLPFCSWKQSWNFNSGRIRSMSDQMGKLSILGTNLKGEVPENPGCGISGASYIWASLTNATSVCRVSASQEMERQVSASPAPV